MPRLLKHLLQTLSYPHVMKESWYQEQIIEIYNHHTTTQLHALQLLTQAEKKEEKEP